MTKANDDEIVWVHLNTALEGLIKHKPGDRSQKDRHYAVAITELEKIVAYFRMFVIEPVVEEDDE